MLLGNGIIEQTAFTPLLAMSWRIASRMEKFDDGTQQLTNKLTLQNIFHSKSNGNVWQQNQSFNSLANPGGNWFGASFGYDAVNRLTSVNDSGGWS